MVTVSNHGAGRRTPASRERAASPHGHPQRPSTAPTLSASSHASRIIRMLVGERRRAAEHEHPAAESRAEENPRFPGDATGLSAELGRRAWPKPSNPLKTLFGASANKNAPTRKSRRSTIPRPRLNLFSSARKSTSTTSHAQPAPTHTPSHIQPRVPGVFVPSLPDELWLLIFRYAAYPPFVDLPGPTAASSSLSPTYVRPYPYPTTYDPHPEPVSFLQHPAAHAHLEERRAAYRAQMRAKAALRYVCRAWSVVAEEVLWEFVWVGSAREGRRVAEMLGGDVGDVWVGASVCVGGKGKEDGKKEKEAKGKAKGKKAAVDATSVVPRRSSSFALAPPSAGRWIRRLHVETRALERCSPHDLLLILQNCPNLVQYSDQKSVRRPMHPLMLSFSDVAPFNVASDGHSSPSAAVVRHRQQHQQQAAQTLLTPDALLSNLLERPLRRLTWTNYEYDASDLEAGVRFYEDVVAPRLGTVGGRLEYLEIVLSGGAMHGMGQRAASGWGVGGACEVRRRERQGGALVLSRNPAQAMYGAANMLTELEAAYTSTSTTVHAPALAMSAGGGLGEEAIASVDGFTFALRLPALKTLKATFDNATFLVLSTWDMPQLTHLSIVSADFGYAALGFRRFFEAHGTKLTQLELGHSSGAIEEAWITDPIPVTTTTTTTTTEAAAAQQHDAHDITLAAWCPNLTEFICSADTEWNWKKPDWIAPHVLLPAHAGLQFIGVRDMEKRLLSDLDEALRRRRGDGLRSARDVEDVEGWEHWGDDDDDEEEAEGGGDREDDPYFALLKQFGSLLRTEAFPALRSVRDMSWESDVMRRTCTMRPLPSSAAASLDRVPTPEPQPLEQARHTAFVAHQHWWSTAAWAQTEAAGGKAAREGQARRAAREAEEGFARAYGRRLNVFWRRVVRMCRRRGVWLEDCFGVNVERRI